MPKSGFQLKGKGPKNYEAFWVPALMGLCAADLVSAANVQAGDRVLDVGCGTGVVTREAADRTASPADVTGADINDAMLGTARHFADRHGMPDIRWHSCDAASMPFEDAAFDVVLCQQGLQFMPDRPAAMAEMARVLAPNGRLAVSVWKSRPSAWRFAMLLTDSSARERPLPGGPRLRSEIATNCARLPRMPDLKTAMSGSISRWLVIPIRRRLCRVSSLHRLLEIRLPNWRSKIK